MDVPSFSSFPPSFSSFPDLDLGPSKPPKSSSRQTDEDRSKRKDKHRKEKKLKDIKHTHEDVGLERRLRRHRSKERAGKEVRLPFDDERLKEEEDRWRARSETQPSSSKVLFYSDRKGDPLNVQYGGLHAASVPRYHLVGWGRKILGLNQAFTAMHRSRQGVEVGVGSRRRVGGITDHSARTLLKAPPKRRVIPSSDGPHTFEEVDGFIKLPSRRRDDQAYRSIETVRDNAESDFDSSSESADASESTDDDADELTLTSYQEKMKALEQQLSADPSSVPTWLSLLSHSLSQIPVTSRNATKARSEITLSILERALSSLQLSSSAVQLKLKYLQAGEAVWLEAEVKSRWEDALKLDHIEIWLAWLEWRFRKGEGGVDGATKDVLRVVGAVTNEIDRLRIMWRVAIAFRQYGFVERAVALFQAQAELVFCMPPSLVGSAFDKQLDAIEEFWESEVSRVGEPGSKGWNAWVAEGSPEHSADTFPRTDHPPVQVDIPDPYRKWAREEILADQTLQTPLRSTDAEADEDPYGTVLFSDIRPFLCSFTAARPKTLFRLVWLSFAGLHIPGLETALSAAAENVDDRWSRAHLTSPNSLASVFPSASAARRISVDAQCGAIIGREQEYTSGFGPVKNWGYRTVGALDTFGEGGWRMWTKEDMQGVNQAFVRRVFEQCRMGGDDVEWDTLALAFEAAVNVKSALKLSRSFLATARESLPHWAIHARLERLQGRTEAARKVYETVLSAPSSSQTRLSTGPLYWDWAEMEWLGGRPDAALKVTLSSAGVAGTAGGGIAVLRAKRVLEDTVAEIPEMLWKAREAWLRLGTLLELLTASPGGGLPPFLAEAMQAGSVAAESRAVASLSMLYNHIVVLRSAARPTVLRERLQEAARLYPDNTVVLGMFLEVQKGQGVWGRVRELVADVGADGAVKEKNVARRVMDVWIAGWERGRWEWEIERTRSGLNAAVESERTRGSPVLWRIFIEFEIRVQDLKRAKNVLFRAIAQCPGVKELYLLAFDTLRSVFTPRELNELGESMAERGVRMRKGLDEAVEGWVDTREDNRGVEGGDSGEEDEIEYNARELRRLKPY